MREIGSRDGSVERVGQGGFRAQQGGVEGQFGEDVGEEKRAQAHPREAAVTQQRLTPSCACAKASVTVERGVGGEVSQYPGAQGGVFRRATGRAVKSR